MLLEAPKYPAQGWSHAFCGMAAGKNGGKGPKKASSRWICGPQLQGVNRLEQTREDWDECWNLGVKTGTFGVNLRTLGTDTRTLGMKIGILGNKPQNFGNKPQCFGT